MHSLMLYNERDMSPIQYTKNINGMASFVDAIRKIQEQYHKAEQPPKKKNCGEKTSLRYEK